MRNSLQLRCTATALGIVLCLGSGVMAKQTVIRVRTWWTGIDSYWQKSIFEPYEKANRDIKIDYKAIPWSEYWQKQLLMLSTGQVLGEVMLIDAKWTQDAIASNLMMPLDSFIRRDRIDTGQFVQASLREYRKDLASSGTLYGLPLISSAQVLYYNKDIFAQSGMTSPGRDWTWEDTLGYARKLTKDANGDGKPEQWGWGDDWYTMDCMLRSYGVNLVSDDFSKATFNTPAAAKALSTMLEASKARCVSTDDGAMFKGKVAMRNMGDWRIPDFLKSKVKFSWDITVPPKGPVQRSSLAYSNGFFIPPFLKQDKKEAAWKLIKYILQTPKKSDLGMLYLGMQPSYAPLAASKEYLDGDPKCTREIVLECNEKYAFTHAYPKNLEWHDKAWMNEVYAVMNAKKSPEDGLKAAQRAVDVIISTWNKRRAK